MLMSISGGCVQTVKENTETLAVASKETGLAANADKTKYIFMTRDQNVKRNHSVIIDNRSCERVEEFKHLGKTLTNQNSIQETIKSRVNSGNICYHSAQIPLSSSLLSKNLKIKIYRNIIYSYPLQLTSTRYCKYSYMCS